MTKSLYIAEKPSVAQEFARVLGVKGVRKDGYLESDDTIVTWCVGHLITMSYPEKYDPSLKKWSLSTLPFLPETFKYEVIPSVSKQFAIVAGLLKRQDVETIYVCTDSGREGEYIYRLVAMMADISGKKEKRVWIDSQTEEEILRGIRQAKDLSFYDNLSNAAYLRAKEDYLMGINFSRILSLKYGNSVAQYVGKPYIAIAVGRVMTCVLGMVVKREREIRDFVKTPFYRILANLGQEKDSIEFEWKAVEGSKYFNSPLLYKENGFKRKEDARELLKDLEKAEPFCAFIEKIEKKKEKKNPPLLYNLAELQNECSRLFKISPDETLKVVQELYEKKLVTYPRTDARVLSSAVAKEIHKNLRGLTGYEQAGGYANEILSQNMHSSLAKTRYVNDKQITDHYAIIPTGQGIRQLSSLPAGTQKVYEIIARRFLSIFYPAALYQKLSLTAKIKGERFFSNLKILAEEGFLKVTCNSFDKKSEGTSEEKKEEIIKGLKKGACIDICKLFIKEGETSPPKRYTSGSMILAMENAGQLIEDEELRSQIKGSGIGTSATRAEILKKLISIRYLQLNKKTQVISPELLGEMIFDVVNNSIRSLLNPELTASWEKGLTLVAEGKISEKEYMDKLEHFIKVRIDGVKGVNNQYYLRQYFDKARPFYKLQNKKEKKGKKNG